MTIAQPQGRWRSKAAKRREQRREKQLAATEAGAKEMVACIDKLGDEQVKKDLHYALDRSILRQIIYLIDPFDAKL